jgi:lysozyme
MNISEEGISLIKNYEGCKLEAYQDSVGVWTIAYGHTKDVKDGDKINQDEAEHLLQEEMPEYEGYINDMVKVPLDQCQFDALVCWVYNLGVPEQIKRWNKAGGVILGGLVKRREAEANLFEGKEWSKV